MEQFPQIVEFIRKLYRQPGGLIPLHAPVFMGNEKRYLEECIDTTFVSSVGKFVDQFEESVASYTKSKKAVVCVNGTNALHLAMLLVGVDRDDEVITQALTFIATCNAVSYLGAHPVFLDVDRHTLGLSPTAVKAWLVNHTTIRNKQCYNNETGRRVKACIPMHTFGHPVEMEDLVKVCADFHLELVEDAAESIGSCYQGKHTGTFGKVGILSFNGNKTITSGGGGMLLFQDDNLGKLAKYLTTQAKVPHRWDFVHDHIGYNYRMPNLNAALGCAQMENLDFYITNKRATAENYRAFFENIQDFTFFSEPNNCYSNYWLNAIILKDKATQEKFLQYTNECGIMTRPIWRLMNKLPMFSTCETDSLMNTHWLEERVVNIPSSVRQ